MKEHQVYNSAIEDVLNEIKKWWDSQRCTQDLINNITKLKKDANVVGGEE